MRGALAVLLLAGCGEAEKPEIPAPDPDTQRTLAQGQVVGYAGSYDDHAWRGIPYAQAPAGDLRWRPPQAPEAWEGALEALTQGASCPQFASPTGGPNGEEAGEPIGSEDCLFANVFAPRFAPGEIPEGDALLPVMLWIHGGGNTIGSSLLYNGGRLAARHDVIVVTINYRMGVFGWFTHPSLRATLHDPIERSGNWGTLDLIRALDWVGENAAAFGGDPNNITIFGESAGGFNVLSLLVSRAAGGRFHRAISQSGGLGTVTLAEAENLSDAAEPGHEMSSSEVLLKLRIADGAVDRSAAKVEVAGMDDAEIEAYLRGRSAHEILSVFSGDRLGGMYSSPTLIRDGIVVPMEDPDALFADPHGTADVPTILGTNRDENKLFLLFGSDHVTRAFGLPLWLKDEAAYDLESEYGSMSWKASGVDGPAAAMRKSRSGGIFAYRFDWDEEPKVLWVDFAKMLGAAHAVEIPFVFGTLDLGRGNRFLWDEERIPARDALSDAMMSYWTNFAYTGDPDRGRSGTLERWKAWDPSSPEAPKFLVLDTAEGGGIRMASDTVTSEGLLAQLASDDRFATARQRCGIYYGFAVFGEVISEEQYAAAADGACREFPIEDYPWDE
jgi:para-nitrobenzyl esterase